MAHALHMGQLMQTTKPSTTIAPITTIALDAVSGGHHHHGGGFSFSYGYVAAPAYYAAPAYAPAPAYAAPAYYAPAPTVRFHLRYR